MPKIPKISRTKTEISIHETIKNEIDRIRNQELEIKYIQGQQSPKKKEKRSLINHNMTKIIEKIKNSTEFKETSPFQQQADELAKQQKEQEEDQNKTCTLWNHNHSSVVQNYFTRVDNYSQYFWILIDNIHDFRDSRDGKEPSIVPTGPDYILEIIVGLLNSIIEKDTNSPKVTFQKELFNCNYKKSLLDILSNNGYINIVAQTGGLKNVLSSIGVCYAIDAGGECNAIAKRLIGPEEKHISLITSIIDPNMSTGRGQGSELYDKIIKAESKSVYTSYEKKFFQKLDTANGITFRIPLDPNSCQGDCNINIILRRITNYDGSKSITIERKFPEDIYGTGADIGDMTQLDGEKKCNATANQPEDYKITDKTTQMSTSTRKCIFPRVDKMSLKSDDQNSVKGYTEDVKQIKKLIHAYIDKLNRADNTITPVRFENIYKYDIVKDFVNEITEKLIKSRGEYEYKREQYSKIISTLKRFSDLERIELKRVLEGLNDDTHSNPSKANHPTKSQANKTIEFFMTMKAIGDIGQCLEARARGCILLTTDIMQFIIGSALGTMCIKPGDKDYFKHQTQNISKSFFVDGATPSVEFLQLLDKDSIYISTSLSAVIKGYLRTNTPLATSVRANIPVETEKLALVNSIYP
jgi:hypothetical protein